MRCGEAFNTQVVARYRCFNIVVREYYSGYLYCGTIIETRARCGCRSTMYACLLLLRTSDHSAVDTPSNRLFRVVGNASSDPGLQKAYSMNTCNEFPFALHS